MPDDLIRRSDAKAAIEKAIRENDIIIASCDSFPRETKLRHQQDAFRYILRELEALDSVPAAGAGESKIKHVCDYRCLGDEGHHAWPSPDADLTSRHDAAKE